MTNYADHSYHKLRRLCQNATGEKKLKLSAIIANYYKNFIEKSIRRQHPNWSEAEQKAAVFERMYRDDFPPDEMKRIRAFFVASHDRQTA